MNISLSGFPAYIALILFLLMFAILPMYFLSKVRRKSYEFARQYDTIVKTEYDPPYGLTPAELGYIVDAKFSKREFFATILDLEQRGFIEINKSLYSYELLKLSLETSKLHKHEKLIVHNFTNTSSLSLENRKNLKRFRQTVLSSLVSKGLVKPSAAEEKVSFLAGRIILTLLVINTLLTILITFADDGSLFETIFFALLIPIMITPITLPISIVLGYVYHKIVGETGLWTKEMKQAWVEIAGYSHFVKQVELDNIQFESSELKSKTKIKAFPYAVALGLDTNWEKRFRE